ncbi:MAG: hypothetical protein M1475_05820 [Actinobacteria bacterium]|nr:hypothetical protein [Actinomycetota bacterium]MCL6087911.1 hypothetical protein [Actinomycetota bacterium]
MAQGEIKVSKSRLFNDTPYLPFQVDERQIDTSLDISKSDIKILRQLGNKYAEIASLPIQNDRKIQWSNINSLIGGKPMIWINEVCWHEMNINEELTLKCVSEVGQRIESEIRKVLYQWNHMQGDMIIEPVIYSPHILENTGFGIEIEADIAETEINSTIASRHFHNQLMSETDIEKIKTPHIIHKIDRTEKFFQVYKNIFDGILKVEKRGCHGFWFAPWDDIVFWMGADNVLMNLATKPDFMHKIIKRLVDAYLGALEQFKSLGLLAQNDTNVRIGSGAYGYVKDLPHENFDKNNMRIEDLWSSATAQIFGGVSPKMHKEFALEYEKKWLSQFGLSYYGCCEPLHNKIEVFEEIPNLRKISMSPWANIDEAAEKMRGKYVMSLKPSSSILAFETWEPELVKKELEKKLKAAKGCSVEIVLKDISTVKHQPWRLWEWAKIAKEVIKKIYKE